MNGYEYWSVQFAVVACGLFTGVFGFARAWLPLTIYLCAQGSILAVAQVAFLDVVWWLGLMITLAVLGGLSVPALRGVAALVDEVAARRSVAEREQAAGAAQERVERELARGLHDEVAHALRACSLPEGALPEDLVVRQCREAVAMLDLVATTATATNLRNRLIALAGQQQSLSVTVTGTLSLEPPDLVAEALTAMVGEAIRNIGRHARTDRAGIHLGAGPHRGSVVVAVTDSGQGFDVGSLTTGFGIDSSIRQRGEDIGADVVVTSRRGAGTTVTITWHQRPCHPVTPSAR